MPRVTADFCGLLAASLLMLISSGCGGGRPDDVSSSSGDSSADGFIEQHRAEVTLFCGGCHNVPSPDTFPADAWYREVTLAYSLFELSGRKDLTPPPQNVVVDWYRRQAPSKISLTPLACVPSSCRFLRIPVPIPVGDQDGVAGVSHINVLDLGKLESERILFCDMRRNGLFELQVTGHEVATRQISGFQNPAHITQVDFDKDGRSEWIVSELGSLLPADHSKGRVVLYLPEWKGRGAVSAVLLENVGRIADVEAGDFDGDGNLDLVVAEFGWRTTGGVHLLMNGDSARSEVPQFQSQKIDDRHGAIHSPVADLDQDGDLDIVCLFSQEYERIEAFINDGRGKFERQVIHLSGDPSFGSSGIELADLDGDGDLDVVYSNGDSLDSEMVKPCHGIQWLENEGDFPFRYRRLISLPGACRAVAADLDGDLDLDIVAAAWIPLNDRPPSASPDGLFDTLVWLEQTDDAGFLPHSIQRSPSGGYMAVNVADLNSDGKLDILAGRFNLSANSSDSWIDLFEQMP